MAAWLRSSVLAFLLLALLQVPAEEPKVALLTFGPGGEFFEVFGHNALLVEVPGRTPIAIDWGRFDLDAPGFTGRFVRDEMIYQAGAAPLPFVLDHYTFFDRDIVRHDLNLTPAETAALLAALDDNLKPANVNFRYDYYLANCSTELRDRLNNATGGLLERSLKGEPAGTTLRVETARHAERVPWMGLALHVGMGRPTDEPIDRWRQAFLPGELAAALADVRRDDGTPLLGPPQVLHAGGRPPVPAGAPGYALPLLAFGLVIGGATTAFGVNRRTRYLGRAVGALWCLVAGVGACTLLFMWLFTGHDFANPNLAILWLGPTALPLAALLIRPGRVAAYLAAATLGLAVLATLLLLVPQAWQGNGSLALLTLPAHAGVLALTLRPAARSATPPTDTEPT